MRTRLIAALVATLLLGTIVGTSAVIVANSDEEPTTTTTRPVRLTATAQELIDLLATKDETTYHARYTGSSPEASEVSLETWQLPPKVRQDSNLTIEDQRAQTSSFVLGSDQVRCVRIGEATPWSCQPGGPADTDPLAAMRSRLGEVDVSARDTTIGDRSVRCFEFTVEGATNELCLTADRGIPVLIRAAGSELELVELDEDVTDDDFEPPAEVQSG